MPNLSLTFDTNQNTYTAVLLCGSTACTMDEACVQDMCVQRGSLSFVGRWSRGNGQGHLIVRTPLNNTIYFGNPRINVSADQGHYEQVGDGSRAENIYWPSNSAPPRGFYQVCFSTGTLLNGSDTSPVTVTIQVRRNEQAMTTMTRTFNTSTRDVEECVDSSDTFIGSISSGIVVSERHTALPIKIPSKIRCSASQF